MPPQDTFKIQSARPDVRFLSQAVQPPSQVYVEQTDVLRIAAASSQVGESLTVSWRLLLPNGDVVLNQASLAVPATRVLTIHDEPMAEGFLLSVSCRAAVATTRGQTFARIFLTDPDLGAGQPSYMLMADYVTTAMAPSHPNGRVLAPTEGPGFIHLVLIANPLAGNDFIFTLPTNVRWRLQTMNATFATSNLVATRFSGLRFRESAQVIYSGPAIVTQAASTTNFLSWAPGLTPRGDAANRVQADMPSDLILGGPGTTIIEAVTFNITATDQWTNIFLLIEEWLDNV